MKYNFFLILILISFNSIWSHDRFTEDLEDNEFAEFEDFDEDDEPQTWKDKQDIDGGYSSKQRHAADNDNTFADQTDDDEDNIIEVQ